MPDSEEETRESQWHRATVLALETMERGHRMDGRPLRARLCARPEISPESNSVQTPQDETVDRGSPCVYARKK